MTCPICHTDDVTVLASHGFGGAETVHDLSCGHDVTMSQVRAAAAAPAEPAPPEETNDGEQASGLPESPAVDSEEGGPVGEGGGSDPGVTDTQGQPGSEEGESGAQEGSVSDGAAADVAEPATEAATGAEASATTTEGVNEAPLATPAAIAHADEVGVDLTQVDGSGVDGKILKADVVAAEPDQGAS